MAVDASFGRWLQQRRKALSLTQAELAHQVGCATVTIHKIELEERRPSTAIAERLAACLEVAEGERRAFVRFARGETALIQPTPLPPQVLPVPVPAPAAAYPALPEPATPLLGREREVASLRALFGRPDVRLVTLVGPGGIGKTRLALQVAGMLRETFADGLCFVTLAPIADPALVLPTIAQALGLTEGGGSPPGQRSVTQLHAYLRAKALLLVLDNLEQVLDAAVELAEVLDAAPGVKVLATSRAPLRLMQEQEFPVPPLALPDLARRPRSAVEQLAHSPAVALFVHRARAVQPDFALRDENVRAVAGICARVDGLPLAIELAATRVRLLPPPALLRRLESRLALLTGGARDRPARQQTLRATIDWSYNLLQPAEQALFRRLGVFVGGFTLEAVAVVCPPSVREPLDVPAELSVLLDHSLVQASEGFGGEPRFTMLETIREYAMEGLVASGEVEALRQQHATYMLELAQAAEPHLEGADQAVWLARLEAEHANIRAALDWALTDATSTLGLHLTGALWRFWWGRGNYTEGRRWLERALASSVDAPALVHRQALAGAAWLTHLQGDAQRARELSEACLDLGRDLGDPWLRAFALRILGWRAVKQGRHDRATTLLQESLALARTAGDLFLMADSVSGLAFVAADQGAYAQATALLEQALHWCRQLGFTGGIAWALEDLGWFAYEQGDHARAVGFFEQSLVLRRGVRSKAGIAQALGGLGAVALAQGDVGAARKHFEERLWMEQELDNTPGIAGTLIDVALVRHAEGDDGAARTFLAESLALARQWNNWGNITANLRGWAVLALARGEPARAARLYGAADVMHGVAGGGGSSVEHRLLHERMVAGAREQLGEARFAEAWAAGQAMTPDEAIALALERGV